MKRTKISALRTVLSPLALAGFAAVGMTAPAQAQKAPSGAEKPAKDKKEAAPAKASYSKEFVAAYKPLEAAVNAATPDYAALKTQLPGLLAISKSPDEMMATGRVMFQVGQKSQDNSLSLQGAELMINSGKADPKLQNQLRFVVAQLSYNLKDYAKAQTMARAAVDAGYDEDMAPGFVAETYFAGGQYAEGMKYLTDTINARKAAGKPIPEAWVKRALAVAYTNKLNDDARRYGLLYAREFPGAASWGDAIAIAINTGNYAPPEMLDLLRLARKTGTMRTKQMYFEYVDAADARKLPSEVQQVIADGVKAKMLDTTVQAIKDSTTTATARLAADKAELPALLRDANGGAAKLVTVMAAADTLLSYGRNDEAVALYTKALGMPGANTQLALTRLGIAQVNAGKYADAQATLAKVTGPRQPIAALWALYAAQKAVPAPIPAPTTS